MHVLGIYIYRGVISGFELQGTFVTGYCYLDSIIIHGFLFLNHRYCQRGMRMKGLKKLISLNHHKASISHGFGTICGIIHYIMYDMMYTSGSDTVWMDIWENVERMHLFVNKKIPVTLNYASMPGCLHWNVICVNVLLVDRDLNLMHELHQK